MYPLGCVPEEVIKKAVREQCPNGYDMTIRDQDEWSVIAKVWNQGIDSHLEALTERSSADSTTGEINIHPDELHVLLRRLFKDGSDEAWTLRMDILGTLGIKEL